MTTSRHAASPLRTRRHWTTDRIISAGLAVTACAGMVGVIGVSSIEDSSAAQQATAVDDSASSTEVVSSAPRPIARPAPKPEPRPQSNTKSS